MNCLLAFACGCVAGCTQNAADKSHLEARLKKLECDTAAMQEQLKSLHTAAKEGNGEPAKKQESDLTWRAKYELKVLEVALTQHHVRQGFYPESLKSLTQADKLGLAVIGDSLLNDPWGNPYIYDPKTRNSATDAPLIYSNGPPGKQQRLTNWD